MDETTREEIVTMWLGNPTIETPAIALRFACTHMDVEDVIYALIPPARIAWRERMRRVALASRDSRPISAAQLCAERGVPRKYERSRAWNAARKAARKRDRNTCQVCGLTAEIQGRNMSVHHRRPYVFFAIKKRANRLNNLICLCHGCHRRAEIGSIILPIGLAGDSILQPESPRL